MGECFSSNRTAHKSEIYVEVSQQLVEKPAPALAVTIIKDRDRFPVERNVVSETMLFREQGMKMNSDMGFTDGPYVAGFLTPPMNIQKSNATKFKGILRVATTSENATYNSVEDEQLMPVSIISRKSIRFADQA